MTHPITDSTEQVALSLGANIGDAHETIMSAVRTLELDPDITLLRLSSLYVTAPVGKTDQADFVNCAAIITTQLSPEELIHRLLSVEQMFGRTKREQWFPRELDIDIVLFGSRIINTADLVIPHPRMHQRRFVLEPLAEIAPTLIHPILNQDIGTMLSLCDDKSSVQRIPTSS